ncbi:UPF0481 protein At3g47200-like [Juglans microcarpa x Juglans regia]|uniref:UPF0481 protein At3g47200-like n=1 Tax=Juglans microcarpa x Juglans regia TaxID=2249226 RepID=UPI001B7EE756|nr:UPF0481 protein At3g47200-like [Juglans microcarpa x Juglans regia]
MAGESASFDDHEHDANASFIKNHEHAGGKKLSEEIAGMLGSLKPFPESPGYCIYKVSEPIRQSNEQAYTPQVISIGPFHRNNPKLQSMEEFKLRYLQSFRDRDKINLEDLVSAIKGAEEGARERYSEPIKLGSDDFLKMILVDAIFIIEFFRKNWSKIWTKYDRRILTPWLSSRVQMDLILLENQLPFFIIEKIYDIAFPSLSKDHPFIELTFCQFQYFNVQGYEPRDFWSSGIIILHFTDLLRNFCLPPCERQPERSVGIIKEMHSATQLAEIGLKFKKITSNSSTICSPLELKYADGVLEIPCFQLDITTEIHARNLVALEECHFPEDAYITDYYILLSFLIKTGEDMDLLVREQIIANWLDGVVATSMINKLSEKSFYSQMNSHYQKMAQKLNGFYASQSKLTWRRALFSTPLIGASAISAFLLLLFTCVQSLCSVLSLKYF